MKVDGKITNIKDAGIKYDIPTSQPIQKTANPLIQEARKYKDVRTLTLKTANNKTEYVVNLGENVKDRTGKVTGFKSYKTSPNFKNEGEANKWIKENIKGDKEFTGKQVADIWRKNGIRNGESDLIDLVEKNKGFVLSDVKIKDILANDKALAEDILNNKSMSNVLDSNSTGKPIIIAKEGVLDGAHRIADAYKKNPEGTIKAYLSKEHPLKSQPLQEGVKVGKERGHITSIANSPEISLDMANNIRKSADSIDVKHQLPLVKDAQKTIFNNINEAERIAREEISDRGVIMGDELVKHYDSIAIKSKNSGDMVAFEQAMNKAREVVNSTAPNLTESARALSAANRINKASPEFVLNYVTKIAKDSGTDLKLSNDQIFGFMRKAEEIKGILDPRERAFKTFDLIDDISDNVPRGGKDKLLEALNLPRSIMATADLSSPLRQGIFSAAKHPVMFAKNFKSMFKYAFSEKAYRGLKADIITSPNYNLYQKYKLPITDVSAGLTGREERFMSTLADKIPLFGKISKGSNRAYTGFLNKMRVDLFDDFIKTAKLEGITDTKFFEDAATFVGSATGRGKLGRFEDAAKLLNTAFFSPRLMASRINLINPVYYAKLHPTVRKEALKTLASFVGTGTAVLGLAKLNGAEVGTDPRSADFGKIKIGNTRFDIWGGFQQYARLIGQLTTGEKISTITGKETTLGEGYNAPTRESIFMDFLKSKEAPIFSFLTRAMQGEKFGEKFNLPAEVVDRFIPMLVQDAFDLNREYGVKGTAMALPGMFGVGSQTYGDQIPMFTETPSGNVGMGYRSQPGLGETIVNKVMGKDVSTVPKEYWQPLAEEKLAEQKRQAEVDKAKQLVLITGEPQQVGDTYVYLENGIVKTKKQSKDKRTPLKDRILYEKIQERANKTQPFYK
jgi:hypothetical protein